MLTELAIKAARATAGERAELWDGRVPGFGVRVSPNGIKAFILLYRCNGRARRMTLGRYPLISLAQARKHAMVALGDLARGIDPGTPVQAASRMPP